IIPTTGWGKEYVVAAYHSLYELTFDYPSEFAVVAQRDGTTINVVPTQDIRQTGKPKTTGHSKGVAFMDQLDRGSAVQYQLTQAQDADNWDVTGTVVTSDKNVG